MAKKVYACRSKGNADRAFRTTGRGKTSLSEKKAELEAKRSQPKHRTVQLSGALVGFQAGAAPPSVTAQVVHLNSNGTYQSTSLYDQSTLPTVTVYSRSSKSHVQNDVINVEFQQGKWWYGEVSGGGATGYGELDSPLGSGDNLANVTLDNNSPLDPGLSIQATNWVGMDGTTGAKCIVSKTGSEYILIQLQCPPETP